MELHEQPSSWAEAWLTFQDQTFSSLGLGTKKVMSERKDSDADSVDPLDWQMSVLEHLRSHVDSRIALTADQDQAIKGSHDWGPDFPEHLNLAEFALRRLTYAVGVLQDPEKHDRPILLREYTEEMVLKVARDLRQWLHQLGTLLGLYHVHLLDLEAERCKLATLLENKKQELSNGQEERKTALRRHDVLSEHWEEEKMRQDAERLLGIQRQGVDAKIYSQQEVDAMFKQWEKEHLDPLLAELKELRLDREQLREKLRAAGKQRPPPVN